MSGRVIAGVLAMSVAVPSAASVLIERRPVTLVEVAPVERAAPVPPAEPVVHVPVEAAPILARAPGLAITSAALAHALAGTLGVLGAWQRR